MGDRLVHVKTVEGSVYIAWAHVVSVQNGPNGTTLRLVDGRVFESTEKLDLIVGRIQTAAKAD